MLRFSLLLLLILLPSWRPIAGQQERRPGAGDISDTSTPATEGNADAFAENAERELFRLLNEERRKQGLEPVAQDARLRSAARQHSTLMAERRLLSHQFENEPEPAQRMADAGVRFDRSGENVAFGPVVQEIHEGLMKSPAHRANILKPEFNAAGVGVVREHGQLWITQNFVRRLEFHTAEEAENMLARQFQEARRKTGQKPLRREQSAQLREAACRMAERGKLDTRDAKQLFGSGGTAAYSGADVSQLPSEWRKVAELPALSRYAIGVCFQRSAQHPSGAYWAVMAFE